MSAILPKGSKHNEQVERSKDSSRGSGTGTRRLKLVHGGKPERNGLLARLRYYGAIKVTVGFLAFLTALVQLLIKLAPTPKEDRQQVIGVIKGQVDEFKKTGDTTHLGRFRK